MVSVLTQPFLKTINLSLKDDAFLRCHHLDRQTLTAAANGRSRRRFHVSGAFGAYLLPLGRSYLNLISAPRAQENTA